MINFSSIALCSVFAILSLPFCLGQIRADGNPPLIPFNDPSLSLEKRAGDIVARMTIEEKVSQMMNNAPAIDRLGIPAYDWWNECLHGVARAGRATVFPQAIGLAATWDTDLMYWVATATSDEARAKHHEFLRKGKRGMYEGLTFWSPNINIFRDPRWGRGMETYGEDPFLTGSMAVQFIRGLQGDNPKYLKVVATSKHYAVHSGPEPDRHTFDARIEERDLQETYLPHFRMSILDGKAYSVMGAYNRFMGVPCCASERLLKNILRDSWGFDGYVVSDCGAIYDIFQNHKVARTPAEAAAMAVRAGCDLNCGTVYENLVEAVKQGLVTEQEIDTAVRRLFTARLKLGMFDPPEMVPYAAIPYSVVDCTKHRELALEAARKSIVLLKNDRNALPLKKDIPTIAVIGPNADDVEVLLGNYNGTPVDPVTPLRGIREKVSKNTKVVYAPGCEWAENLYRFEVVPSTALFTTEDGKRRNGLRAEYFNNRELKGKPALTRTDPQIDFTWWDGAPLKDFNDDDFGVRWTGELVAPVTGTYALGGNGFSGFRIFLDDRQLVTFESPYHPVTVYENVNLEAGKSYRLRVEFYEKQGDAHMKLIWSVPARDYKKEAVDAARQSDAVIMVMGLSPRLEGEEMKVQVKGFKGGDRLDINLPDIQEDLIRTISALGKPTVLVLLNGSAVAVNQANDLVPAIIEAWYPGQAAGTAIADVLFGDCNPAGRLPVTFYRSVDQLPPFGEYAMKGRTYRYFTGDPLYPFGHGLSYTSFLYSGLTLPKTAAPGQDVAVSVTVTNTGAMAGEEVVQLYLTDLEASAPVPVRSLCGFQRISLKPGEKQVVKFTLNPRQFSLIDTADRRVIEPGTFEVAAGGKQPGFSGSADAPTTGVVTGRFTVTGKVTEIE
ncbi:glycoside hydrolase family 3 C-terminal domain-containing protein [bacterium]|nr:glycoside hydrolase family 3 C-terminal domain-containing protein [bacterium]